MKAKNRSLGEGAMEFKSVRGMSSGFVSGGTTDKPIERDDEWLKAQQELEANRRRKEEEGRQEGGKSLFEVLQSNKAAKQEAFEESIRLKNQFRNLDEDEVEFLDSVLESTRAKEDAVKKETAEQLNLFRRQQEEADKAALNLPSTGTENPSEAAIGPESSTTESQWAINARKRKRVKDKEVLPGVKLRKSSSTSEKPPASLSPSTLTTTHLQKQPQVQNSPKSITGQTTDSQIGGMKTVESPPVKASPDSPNPTVGALGLAGYSSDEDA
ncbi:MAG: hypothetical protein Q9226_007122 [Calogaya cf. arnoldii]